MHVSLTPELEVLIKQHVQTGRYHSSSELVREAMRLWQEHEQLRTFRMEHLRKEIKVGLESGSAEALDFTEVKKRGRARLKSGKNIR